MACGPFCLLSVFFLWETCIEGQIVEGSACGSAQDEFT